MWLNVQTYIVDITLIGCCEQNVGLLDLESTVKLTVEVGNMHFLGGRILLFLAAILVWLLFRKCDVCNVIAHMGVFY